MLTPPLSRSKMAPQMAATVLSSSVFVLFLLVFQKNSEGSPDCWENHWYNPPHSPRTVLIQSEQKGWQIHSGALTSSTLPLWTVAIWSTLQSSVHQSDQTQKWFLPSSNQSHEHLTINMEHMCSDFSRSPWSSLLFLSVLSSRFLRLHQTASSSTSCL